MSEPSLKGGVWFYRLGCQGQAGVAGRRGEGEGAASFTLGAYIMPGSVCGFEIQRPIKVLCCSRRGRSLTHRGPRGGQCRAW